MKKCIYVVISIIIVIFLVFIIILTYETIKEISCYNLPPNEFYQSDYCEVYR